MPVTAAATDAQGQMDAVEGIRDAIETNLAGTDLNAGVTGQTAQVVDNNDTFNTAFTVVGSATFVLIIVLPEHDRVREDGRRPGARLPARALDPTEAYLTTSDGSRLTSAQLDQFAAAAATVSGVGGVQPPIQAAGGTVARFSLLLDVNPASNDAITLVHDHLRGDLHAIAPPGTRVLVGGTTALFADINSANNRDLSVILPVAALLIAIILALLLRSIVAPVYLVLAVLLNFAATLGAAIYLFQGLADRPGVTFQLPIVLYLFVLAIGTDYNILMIARLREEARAGNEPRAAAALAVRHGGPSVAAAGLILAGTFAVLALAPVSFLQQIGFSVAAGILLSAFVMSMFLVPSLTALMGHTAWWPGHGDVDRKRAETSGFEPTTDPSSLVGREV